MDNESRIPFVFEVPERNFGRLIEKFTKLTGRARKCKLEPPTYVVIHELDILEKKSVPDRDMDPTGELGFRITIEEWVHYYYVAIDGEYPAIAGWTFVATLDHTDEDVIIKSVPGTTNLPIEYRKALPVCNHCNMARKRNETFILRNNDNPTLYKQIGRNCLSSYLGAKDLSDYVQSLAWWTEAVELASLAEDEDGFDCGSNRGYRRYPIEVVMTTTQAVIEAFGWVSRTKAKELDNVKATADCVDSYLTPPYRLTEHDMKFRKAVKAAQRDEHVTQATAAIEWARSLEPTVDEDYLYNLHTICAGETIRQDRLGLACSLMPAYRRHLDTERRKLEAESNPSEYVGELKKRGLFRNCVLKHVGEPYQNDFGISTRFIFAKDGRDLMVWYQTGAADTTLWVVGNSYDVVCTPQSHDERLNRFTQVVEKQTKVNRVAIATEKDYKKEAKANKAKDTLNGNNTG